MVILNLERREIILIEQQWSILARQGKCEEKKKKKCFLYSPLFSLLIYKVQMCPVWFDTFKSNHLKSLNASVHRYKMATRMNQNQNTA